MPRLSANGTLICNNYIWVFPFISFIWCISLQIYVKFKTHEQNKNIKNILQRNSGLNRSRTASYYIRLLHIDSKRKRWVSCMCGAAFHLLHWCWGLLWMDHCPYVPLLWTILGTTCAFRWVHAGCSLSGVCSSQTCFFFLHVLTCVASVDVKVGAQPVNMRFCKCSFA